MAKKLQYYDFSGLAESIRCIFHYGKHNFEDVRHDVKNYPNKELTASLPYGALPIYQEGDRTLTQSVAIARYAGTLSNLVPSDPWEQAVLDAAVLNIYDMWIKAVPIARERDPTKKEALRKQFLSETVVYFYSRFETELSKNNGHFGGKLSWADFVLLGITETINATVGEEVEKNYPNIAALMEKIKSLPGVKEYVATRKVYSLN